MLNAEYLIFCARKTEDQNGNVSLHDIFDRVIAADFPAHHSPFMAITRLRATQALINRELQVKLAVELDGTVLSDQENPMTVMVEKDNYISLDVDFSQLVFPSAGTYQFKLYVDGKLLITRVLHVQAASDFIEK